MPPAGSAPRVGPEITPTRRRASPSISARAACTASAPKRRLPRATTPSSTRRTSATARSCPAPNWPRPLPSSI